jgi:hypothetical protein
MSVELSRFGWAPPPLARTVANIEPSKFIVARSCFKNGTPPVGPFKNLTLAQFTKLAWEASVVTLTIDFSVEWEFEYFDLVDEECEIKTGTELRNYTHDIVLERTMPFSKKDIICNVTGKFNTFNGPGLFWHLNSYPEYFPADANTPLVHTHYRNEDKYGINFDVGFFVNNIEDGAYSFDFGAFEKDLVFYQFELVDAEAPITPGEGSTNVTMPITYEAAGLSLSTEISILLFWAGGHPGGGPPSTCNLEFFEGEENSNFINKGVVAVTGATAVIS